ncbi:MAG: competence type IV pilus minor pilin ComGD [Bacilli bacterium]
MLRQRLNQSGFTLVEMLLVCFCMSVIVAVGTPQGVRLHQNYMIEISVRQFLTHLQYAQFASLNESQRIEIQIIPNTSMYRMVLSKRNETKRYELAKGVKFVSGTKSLPVVFTASGTINGAGNIVIQNEYGRYSVMMLLGKGKFYVTAM